MHFGGGEYVRCVVDAFTTHLALERRLRSAGRCEKKKNSSPDSLIKKTAYAELGYWGRIHRCNYAVLSYMNYMSS